MNFVGIMLIIIVIFFFIAMISSGSSSYGNQNGGSKKGKFGVVGLVVAIFGILGLSNYLQTVM